MKQDSEWEAKYKETFAGKVEELREAWDVMVKALYKELRLYEITNTLQDKINLLGKGMMK